MLLTPWPWSLKEDRPGYWDGVWSSYFLYLWQITLVKYYQTMVVGPLHSISFLFQALLWPRPCQRPPALFSVRWARSSYSCSSFSSCSTSSSCSSYLSCSSYSSYSSCSSSACLSSSTHCHYSSSAQHPPGLGSVPHTPGSGPVQSSGPFCLHSCKYRWWWRFEAKPSLKRRSVTFLHSSWYSPPDLFSTFFGAHMNHVYEKCMEDHRDLPTTEC